MSSIDERVVQMKFENAAFLQGVQQTLRALDALNKGLQLQGATKGFAGISSVSKQFDAGIQRNRDSMGRFATTMQQSSTSATSFSQKIEQSQGSLTKLSTGVSSLSTHVSTFDQKVTQSRDSMGRFVSGLGETASAANGASASVGKIQGMASAVAGKFTALGTVATGALLSIGARAAQVGTQLLNSLTLAPIMDGFREYETNINSIQTILANTQQAGTTLDDVKHSLGELNHYADQTIYSFSEMAKNIGTFTSAGVDLKTSTAAIKGIANVAAMAGANSESASHVMYQLSQAISSGTVTMEDWTSVVNAGMASSGFQRALAMNAEKLGTLKDGAVKLNGAMKTVTVNGKSFTESIRMKPGQKPWLTDKVLLQTLKQFTGDMTDAQLKAEGFSKSEIKMIQAQAKVAKESATQVKTFTQLMDTTKEAIGSGWAQTWQLVFGDFSEAKGLFTGISNSISGMVSKSSNARNKMLTDWKKFGGRDALIEGLGNSVKALGSVLKPIKDAFREIFPATTGKQLADMTKSFRDFTEKLKIGGETADKLKRTFAGVFAIFGIAWDLVKGFLITIGQLFGVIGSGSGGFLSITAKIGDFLVKVKQSIEEGGRLTKFFTGLGKVLSMPIKLLLALTGYIGSLFDKFDSGKASKASSSFSGMAKSFGSLSSYGKKLSGVWNSIKSGIDSVMKSLDPFVKKFKDFFNTSSSFTMPAWIKNLGSMIADGFRSISFDSIIKIIQTGLLGGLLLTFSGFTKKITSGGEGFVDALKAPFIELTNTIRGVGESVTNPLTQITKTLKAMQHALQAVTLLEIAAAILIMAIALGKLAKIDQNGLMRSSAAMTVMFSQLLGSMAIFTKFIGTAGFAKMPFVMGSLILLAEAVNILATAMVKMSGLDWNGVGKGLTGLAGVLVLLGLSVKFMGDGKGLILTGFGLNTLATAISGLVDDILKLSTLDWSELGRGLTGLAGLLLSLALFSKFQNASNIGISSTVGIILLATGIKILTSSVEDFAKLSWQEIGKGLAGVAAILGGLALYTKFSKANAAGIAQGAGIVLLAAGIKILSQSVKDIANLSWQEIGKGLTGVGALLGSLVLFTMFAKADGAGIIQGAGIILLAAGIKILASAVTDFSKLSWNGLAKGLVATGVGLGIFAAALTFIPPTSVFSAAAVLVVASSLGMIADALDQMSRMSWNEVAKGLVSMGVALGLIAGALILLPPTTLLSAAAIFITASALSMIADALNTMGGMSWEAIAKSLVELTVSLALIAAALYLMTAALPGAAALIVVAAALNILAPVLVMLGSMSWESIAKGLLTLAGVFTIFAVGGALLAPVVVVLVALGAAIALIGVGVLAAGAGVLLFSMAITALGKAVSGFSKDVDKAGPGMVSSIGKIISNMAMAVYNNAPKIVAAILKLCISMLNQLNKYVPTLVNAGANLVVAILNGLAKNMGRMTTAATNVVVAFINGVARNQGRVIDAGVKLIISFVNGVANSIRSNSAAMNAAGRNLGSAIIQGMVAGISGGIGAITSAAKSIASSALSAAKGVLGIHSPSKEFEKIGKYVNDGFKKGLDGNKGQIDDAFKKMADQLKALSKNAKATGAERKKALAAYNYLTKSLKDEHAALDKLSDKYDKYTQKIKDAKQALDDIKKTRDDFKKSITDQYSVLPDISADTTVANYETDLKTQIEKTKEFANTLQRLRDLGLNDEAYKQLLSKGIDALPFANQLLAGGKNAVNEINSLDSQLATASKALGKSASSELYDAAVQSAEGLVKGLQKQQKAIEHEMDKIADYMVKAIKKKLGIKSPSRAFMEIGGYSARGLIKGLDDMSGSVEKASVRTGTVAVAALRKTLNGFSDLTTTDANFRPVITPVLDLSAVKKDASQIAKTLPTQTISLDTAYAKARSIAEDRMSTHDTSSPDGKPSLQSFSYVQNNYSPKALAAGEIYRKTNNQVSRLKKDLGDS